MNDLVFKQSATVFERFWTKTALVWSLVRVHAFVLFLQRRSVKSTGTEATEERFCSRVDVLVRLQTAVDEERLRAVSAGEERLEGVRRLVSLQSDLLVEPSLTDVTGEGTSRSVDHLVFEKSTAVDEALGADGARVGTLAGVTAQVDH